MFSKNTVRTNRSMIPRHSASRATTRLETPYKRIPKQKERGAQLRQQQLMAGRLSCFLSSSIQKCMDALIL